MALDYKVVLERWPDHEGYGMKFKLLFDGALPPAERCPADIKQALRRQFHSQLKTLWEQHPGLKRSQEDRQKIADAFSRNGYRFVPLVRTANFMACSLSMLLLFRQEPYRPFSGHGHGDLDNRVKTLIDGLRMPSQQGELGETDSGPLADEDPFFCLLEDDKMIFDFQVNTDRLLAPPRPDQVARDVVGVITVHITTSERHELSVFSKGFGFVER